MTRRRAAQLAASLLAASLLAVSLLSGPAAGQGEEPQRPPPGVWAVAPGETLRLSWSFRLREKTHSTDDGKAERTETRAVTALLTAPEDGFRGEGTFALALESVAWTVEKTGYTVGVERSGQRAPQADLDLKDDGLDAFAQQERERMLDLVQRAYRLEVRPGEVRMQVETHNGWAGGFSAPSLFDRCYLHSALPDEEELRNGRKWIDPTAPEALPLYGYPGEPGQFPEVELKLKLTSDGLSAKGSGAVRYTGRTLLNWKYAGKGKITRSFTCGPNGHLLASEESATGSIKRTDRGKRDDGTLEVEQTLTLKPVEQSPRR